MTITDTAAARPVRVARDLSEDDLRTALQKGWEDFRAQPAFGLFFAGFFTLGGLLLYFGLIRQGQTAWILPVAAGFPLLAPFAGVGLYEVSRRRETGAPMDWLGVLGALRGRGNEQLLLMAITVLIFFGFWIILARGIFAIFFAHSGIGVGTLGMILSPTGFGMAIVGTAAGAMVALALFTITVTSLPMLLDRDVDFVTAMITSAEVVRANHVTMLKWALVITAGLAVAMIPLFLGLLVVLPVLGHATWHLYRRALPVADDTVAGDPAAELPAPPPADRAARAMALPDEGPMQSAPLNPGSSDSDATP